MTDMNPIEDKRPDERLGVYLVRAREARGMSIEKLASVTRLTVKNISLIESGDWKSFPVEAYLRSYLNSICSKLGLDSKRVLDWYSAECGSKYASLLSDLPTKRAKVKPVTDEETKPKSKAVPIVIVIFGLAFVVGSHLLSDLGKSEEIVDIQSNVKNEVSSPVVEQNFVEIPDGAESIPVDSQQADSIYAVKSINDSVVTQAQVDEALKKSDLPESATIFISSTSTKKDSIVKPVSNKGKTKFELVGSGEMRSWVGLKRHEEDGAFLKEANISSAGTKMVYNTNDTLYVVIGEPRAVSKLLLNGVETPLPEMKFGRVTRFCVYDGAIVSKGTH